MTDLTDASAVDRDFKAYYLALGKFLHDFASIESMTQYLLRQECCVDGNVGPAIFSGVNIDAAKSLINRVRDAKGIPYDAMLKRIFSQMTIITTTRNNILHYGARYTDRGFSVTNEMKAHTPERIEIFEISPDILEYMTKDLATIFAGLWICIQNASSRRYGQPHDATVLRHLSAIQKLADAPWRYTPTQQPPASRQRQEPSLKQPRRRKPSKP